MMPQYDRLVIREVISPGSDTNSNAGNPLALASANAKGSNKFRVKGLESLKRVNNAPPTIRSVVKTIVLLIFPCL